MLSEENLERRAQYHRAIFDAIPVPVFIVDADVAILDFNSAGETMLGGDSARSLNRRAGEAFRCVHSDPKGCGRGSVCRNCVIRACVAKALRGDSVRREEHRAHLRVNGQVSAVELRVTACLLPYTEKPQVLLVLEQPMTSLPARPKRTKPGQALKPAR